MPLVNGQYISPDDAIAKDLCPECGKDLKTVNPLAERRSHWYRMPNDDVDGAEGRRRIRLFDDYIAAHDFRSSDDPRPAIPNAAPRE